MAEEKSKDEKKKGMTVKVPKNPWMISTVVLLIILAVLVVGGPGITGRFTSTTMSGDDASKKAVDYINEYVLAGQGEATVEGVQEVNNLYNLKLVIMGREYDTYMTMDGKLLFPSVIDLEEIPETSTQQQQQTEAFDAPDKEKPTVMLFVMSFCPYGQQAEQAMKPVVDLFGDKAIFEPHFIVSISGDTINSLHGEYEATEDMRQACVWKNYGQEKFWQYVDYINNNCNSGNLDECWKDAAKEGKISTLKIESCVEKEGLTLMKNEEALSEEYGVTGSPTMFINGVRYSGSRTAEAYKNATCSGFIEMPEECSEAITSEATATPSGTC